MSEERQLHQLEERVGETGKTHLYLNGRLVTEDFVSRVGRLENVYCFGREGCKEKIQHMVKHKKVLASANAYILGPRTKCETAFGELKVVTRVFPIEYFEIWGPHLKQLLDGRDVL